MNESKGGTPIRVITGLVSVICRGMVLVQITGTGPVMTVQERADDVLIFGRHPT
jgi:hypothetical protein